MESANKAKRSGVPTTKLVGMESTNVETHTRASDMESAYELKIRFLTTFEMTGVVVPTEQGGATKRQLAPIIIGEESQIVI